VIDYPKTAGLHPDEALLFVMSTDSPEQTGDHTLGDALALVNARWHVSDEQAATLLGDIAADIDVPLRDLVELIVRASKA
jgi:hypothetical protein